MEASKVFLSTGTSFESDLETAINRVVTQGATLGTKEVDIKGNSVCTLALIINFANNPATAEKEIISVIDSTGRSGTDAAVLVGVCRLLESYGNGNFGLSIANNLDSIKAVKARFEKKAGGESTAGPGLTTPKGATKGTTKGTPKTSPQSGGTPEYAKLAFAPGSAFGDAVIGAPPPFNNP